jgi:hypothetical protein
MSLFSTQPVLSLTLIPFMAMVVYSVVASLSSKYAPVAGLAPPRRYFFILVGGIQRTALTAGEDYLRNHDYGEELERD